MTNDKLQILQAAFESILPLSPEAREAALNAHPDLDDRMRQKVRSMLEQHENDESLAAPFWDEAWDEVPLVEGPGDVIGRYKLLQKIGEGGFGVVYMAEQEEPVRRKVALKIIKLGMDTKEVVARFEAERQALAMMDHSNIAKVLDGGTTKTGRPFFVMELVRGVSITEYCDTNRLDTVERLKVFGDVCHAVQHAHLKGVIHRDLKPSNVLVTTLDGKPIPKVIDFGIAKAMHARLTEKTLFTEFRHFIGTPAYMSPEQAEMSALDVDTRTDIYSLGVLLYELLTGSTPFDTKKLIHQGLDEIKRVIREVEPPKPSLRISDASQEVVKERRLDREELSRSIEGDLDWIILKALEKERGRRYETAKELFDDIGRHLNHEPVVAGPPTTTYRMKKFLRRNKAAVLSATIIAFSLIGGIVGTSLGMIEAGEKRDEAIAESRRADAKEKEANDARQKESQLKVVAEERANQFGQVVDFMDESLSLVDPEAALDPNISVLKLLDTSAAKIPGRFDQNPAVEARIRRTIGRAYNSLGFLRKAFANLKRASDLTEQLEDYDRMVHYQTLWTMTEIAFRLDRNDAFSIVQWSRRVGFTHVAKTHPELIKKLTAFSTIVEDMSHTRKVSEFDKIHSDFEEIVREARASFAKGDDRWPVFYDTYQAAAYTLWHTPHEKLSEPFLIEALRLQEQELPAAHPRRAETMSLLIGVLNRSGRAAEGEQRSKRAIQDMKGVYPKGSWQIAFAESMLGECYVGQKKYALAEPLLVESHKVIASMWTEANFFALDSAARVARLYREWNKPEKAEPYRQFLKKGYAYTKYVAPLFLSHHAFAPSQRKLMQSLMHMEQVCRTVWGPQEGDVKSAQLKTLVPDLISQVSAMDVSEKDESIIAGRLFIRWSYQIAPGYADDERKKLAKKGLEILEPEGAFPFDCAQAKAILSEVLLQTDSEAATELAREALRIIRSSFGGDFWITANAKIRVARCLMKQKLYDEARELLLPSYDVLKLQFGKDSHDTKVASKLIIDLFERLGEPDKAQPYR